MNRPLSLRAARLPATLVLAAAAPSILLAIWETLRELTGNSWGLSFATAIALWTATTIPLVLFAFSIAKMRPQTSMDALPELARALEAVSRAEAVAERQLEVLRQMPIADEAPRRVRHVWPLAIGAILLVASVGLAAPTLLGQSYEAPVHIHASAVMVIGHERARFVHPELDLSARGNLHNHLHMPDDTTFHIEGQPGANLRDVLDGALGVSFEFSTLTLDSVLHPGLVFQANASTPLRTFVAHAGSDTWSEVAGPSYVPRDGDRILITYGPLTESELAEYQAKVPSPGK